MSKYSDGERHFDWWLESDKGSTASGVFDSTSMIVLTDAYIHESNFLI